MNYDIIIFWTLVFACVAGLVAVVPRARSVGFGWVTVYAGILVIAVFGSVSGHPALTQAAGVLWLGLVLLPALIARHYQRQFLQQNYSGATRLARMISWLHPMDGWREQPRIIGALELAQQGNLEVAVEVLNRYRKIKSQAGMTAIIHFYRLTNNWEDFLKWQEEHREIFEQQPQMLPYLLRAKGETGDVRGMADLYASRKDQIRKMIPALARDMARLPLFAFCGRRAEVEKLFAGSLATSPGSVRDFWTATADQAAGQTEAAKQQFERLLPTDDASMRLAVQRRITRLSMPAEPLDPSVEQILEEASRERGHDEKYGRQRSLFSRHARATQILILLNLMMFAAEASYGGGENLDTLYRLGALFAPAVWAGEWWRLITAQFLHFGWPHLAMNMVALWVLGPFMEYALGFWRYLLLYSLTGVGSMAVVMLLGSGPEGDGLTVGASGCIMGLVGATGAIMLRGWRRENAFTAKRRLGSVLLVVVIQTLFDSVVPQVSMTAHLSGAMIGFVITLWLRDRLAQPSGQAPRPTTKSTAGAAQGL
jgi:rhomboid protease GluP